MINTQPRSVMIVAGDPSGDMHAAPIVREIASRGSGVKIWGIGGPSMQREGFEALMPFEPFNRMGFLEVVLHLRFFLNAKKRLVRELDSRRPDVLLCVDYPGLNMLLMKEAAARGIPVVWYIAPMVWAWKKGRAAVLGRHAAHIAVIFPFEVGYFSPYGAPVTFVGNPLVEAMDREGAAARNIDECSDTPHLAIMPGSRRQEVVKTLGVMAAAFGLLRKRYPGLRGTVSKCGHLPPELYNRVMAGSGLELYEGPLRDLLRTADIALVKSGTATLETALMGVPMVIAYKTSRLTYEIGRRLVTVPHIGLPNIVAGEMIVPECIQNEMTPGALATKIGAFIDSPQLYASTARRLRSQREYLGSSRPSTAVAEIVIAFGRGEE